MTVESALAYGLQAPIAHEVTWEVLKTASVLPTKALAMRVIRVFQSIAMGRIRARSRHSVGVAIGFSLSKEEGLLSPA